MIHQFDLTLNSGLIIKFHKTLLHSLDIVSHKAALAYAFSDKEPACNFSDNNSVDSNVLHGGLTLT